MLEFSLLQNSEARGSLVRLHNSSATGFLKEVPWVPKSTILVYLWKGLNSEWVLSITTVSKHMCSSKKLNNQQHQETLRIC